MLNVVISSVAVCTFSCGLVETTTRVSLHDVGAIASSASLRMVSYATPHRPSTSLVFIGALISFEDTDKDRGSGHERLLQRQDHIEPTFVITLGL